MYNFQKDDETTATNETTMPSDKYIPKSKNWTTSHPATEANTATAQGLPYEGPHWIITDDWAIPADKIDSIFVKSGTAAGPSFKALFWVGVRTISGKEYCYPHTYHTQEEATSCLSRLVKELAHPIGTYTRIVAGENIIVDD